MLAGGGGTGREGAPITSGALGLAAVPDGGKGCMGGSGDIDPGAGSGFIGGMGVEQPDTTKTVVAHSSQATCR